MQVIVQVYAFGALESYSHTQNHAKTISGMPEKACHLYYTLYIKTNIKLLILLGSFSSLYD